MLLVIRERERKSETKKRSTTPTFKKKEKEKRERDRALALAPRAHANQSKKELSSRTFSAFRDVWVVFRHYSFFKYGSESGACVYIKERERNASVLINVPFFLPRREKLFFFSEKERRKKRTNDVYLSLSLYFSLSLTLLSYAHLGID